MIVVDGTESGAATASQVAQDDPVANRLRAAPHR
jgi:hypothetical protein